MRTPPPTHLHKSPSNKTSEQTQKLTLAQARKRTQQHPQQASGWKALGAHLIAKQPEEALGALNRAHELAPDDPVALELLARVENVLGNDNQAMRHVERALELEPNFTQGRFLIASILYERAQYEQALKHIKLADNLSPSNLDILAKKSNILYRLFQFEEAFAICEKLIKQQPKNYILLNNAGNIKRDIGEFEEADKYYQKSVQFANSDAIPFSNRLTTLHYRPDYSREQIFQVCKEWQTRFAPATRAIRPQPDDLSQNRRIRIGMVSDGFRAHPVGWMSIAALENLKKHEIELYAYSTNTAVDDLATRIQAAANSWVPVQHLSDNDLAQRILDDRIDILIDLCGHNNGSRMRVMTMEPAPILLKWVGGLINTTGLDAFDYLLTDSVESPAGEDPFYTEKLIRLPDDYICFTPPEYLPQVESLPALRNGYITLGCFNNPIKVNEVLLAEWAKLMHELPNSRLFLKGHQYNSKQLSQRVQDILEANGISTERLIIEGPSNHDKLLETYNRIDIALDPWPYSGGLTTCEAMLMGVPVITKPGPTFAGRHSATHLVNAGMPELVVDTWDDYRERVVGLASDLESLSTIRTHLRDTLLQSPVCDGPRFASNFTNAMRAIWQRYCADKAPAALTIDKLGDAWFEGDDQPMDLQHPIATDEEDKNNFSFSFTGKIVTLDNGAVLVGDPQFAELHKLGAFSTIVFDPVSKVGNTHLLQQQGELHHFPHAVLGDGQPATLFACLDPNMSATLEPLPTERQLADYKQTTPVIAKLPINTQRLDDIEGLESIDWLLLDNFSDSLKVLENGERALANTLLVQTRINFVATHHQQPELAQISQWLSTHGFSFYRLNNLKHYSHLLKHDNLVEPQATQLIWADAIFVPNEQRMLELTDNQKLKLAFVLHTVYGVRDLTYQLISMVSSDIAALYQTELDPDKHVPAIRTTPLDMSEKAKIIQPYTQTEKNMACTQPTPFEPKTQIKAQGMAASAQNATIIKPRKNVDTATHICVGVPIYNEEKHIAKTLESLKAQDADNVHFLVTDNCSTDKTLEICLDVIGDDERFSLVQHKQNIGALENFKFALTASQSNYFMWLGGHDYISGRYLKTAAQTLDKSPHISMVCGQPYAVMNSSVKGVVNEAIYDFSEKNSLVRYLQSIGLLNNCTIFHSLFRRNALQSFDWRTTISGDHVLISHLLWQGQLQYMKEENYYRRYFEQRTSTQSERISGNKSYLSRYDFYNYYLDNFSLLYKGDAKMKKYLEGRILDLLEKRFGTQGLLPDDGF